MVELDKKNGEQKGLRTQVASLNHWTASGHVVVSDIFIILYYIIVLFFSKISAPGGVRTANLTLGKDKAYHCIKRRFVMTHGNNDLYYLSK